MHDIICPHCGKAFKVDGAGYANILKQVRDSEFERQLHERLSLAEKDKRAAIELATARVAGDLQTAAAAKDAVISGLRGRVEGGGVARRVAADEGGGPGTGGGDAGMGTGGVPYSGAWAKDGGL